MFEYALIRSRRRTVALQVKRDGSVVIRAPMKMAKREIERFAESHEKWVAKHLARMAKEAAENPPAAALSGEEIAALRAAARAAAARLVADWAPRMGVAPRGIKITSAATRWGSCSGENRLCFSWRVACLPPALLEYIVVHELAHIREHNHSPRFWATVAAYLPEYEAHRAALRGWQAKIPV